MAAHIEQILNKEIRLEEKYSLIAHTENSTEMLVKFFYTYRQALMEASTLHSNFHHHHAAHSPEAAATARHEVQSISSAPEAKSLRSAQT